MDVDAARRARQAAIKRDLAQAYNDDEACVPEWMELFMAIRDARDELRRLIEDQTQAFANEPDVRVALAMRESTDRRVRERVVEVNQKVRRINLIAPLMRFQQVPLDADELVRPLYRTPRRVDV